MAKGKGGGSGDVLARALTDLAEKMKTLDDAAGRAASSQAGALAPLAGMIDLFQRLSSIPLIGALTPLVGAFRGLINQLDAVAARRTAAEKGVSDATAAYRAAIKKGTDAGLSDVQAKIVAGAEGRKLADAQKALGKVGASTGEQLAVLGGFVGAGIAAVQNITSAVKEFAGVLSPVSLQMFDRAMKDTQAAVGVALLPVLHMMTNAVREAGELILPIARDLEPIFRKLADTMGERLSAEMEALAEVVTALLPILDALAEVDALLLEVTKPVLDAVGMLARLLAPIIRLNVQSFEMLLVPVGLLARVMTDAQQATMVFAEALASAFGFDVDLAGPLDAFKSEADRAAEGMRQLMRTMLLLSAAIMKTIHSGLGDKMIDRMLERAQGPRREVTQGLRPAENVHYVTSEQFGKDILQAAAQAGMGMGQKKTQEELLDAGFRNVLEEMKVMPDMSERIIREIGALIFNLPARFGEWMLWAIQQAAIRAAQGVGPPGFINPNPDPQGQTFRPRFNIGGIQF